MKTTMLIRTMILILVFSAVFIVFTGCEKPDITNDQNPPINEEDLSLEEQEPTTNEQDTLISEQNMLQMWNDLIKNTDADIVSIDVKKYTLRPLYSSVQLPAKMHTLKDEKRIKEILDIARDPEVSFEALEALSVDKITLVNENIETMEIMLKDPNGDELFGLLMNEKGEIWIIEPYEISETRKSYRLTHSVSFEGDNKDIYEDFANFYENEIAE